MAGIYLAYRRICIVFISALGGIFADKFGLNNVYLTALFFTLAGLFLIAVGFTKTGIITAFTFNSINTALAPGNGIMSESNHLKIIAENSTWNDMGAAIGSLVASSLLLSTYLNSIFFIATFVLFGAVIFHIKTTNF